MAEEEGIWGEKPEPVWVPRGYYSKSKVKEDDVQMIILDEGDAWLEKLRAHIDEMKRKADIFVAWEKGRCGYFKPGYGCDSPTGIGKSVMCRKLPNCEVLTEEILWKQVKAARDKLYEELPSGDIDSFALLKVVQTHIAKLDEVLEDIVEAS